MPVSVFQELYEARANDGDTHPIGIEAIAACATLDAPATTEPIVWGWDLGRSQSWTAGVALDARGQVSKHREETVPERYVFSGVPSRQIQRDILTFG